MKKIVFALASVVLVGSLVAADVGNGWEFHGYGRSGIMQNMDFAQIDNTDGIDVGQIGRLGNRNNTYVELELVKDFQADSGVWSKWHVLTASQSQALGTWNPGSPNTGSNIFVREAYAEMGGFKFNKDITIWAGQRYYGRDSVYLTDGYPRDYSGTGAGIQGLAGGNLDIAWLTVSQGGNYYAGSGADMTNQGTGLVGVTNTLDTRYNLGKWQFELAGKYNNAVQNYNTANDTSYAGYGVQGAVQYSGDTFYGFGKGWTKTLFEYGQGLSYQTQGSTYANVGTDSTGAVTSAARPEDKTFYATSYGVLDAGNWQIMKVGTIQRNIPKAGDTSTSMSFALQPSYAFSDNFALQFGLGYAYNWESSSTQGGIAKLTIAPTFTFGKDFFARPQIRPFVSYIVGNDNQILLNGHHHATLFGIQAEVWF